MTHSEHSKMIRQADQLIALRSLPAWSDTQQAHAAWLAHSALCSSWRILDNRRAAAWRAKERAMIGWRPHRRICP